MGRFRHPRVVLFGECDPARVVYFPVFFDWFHQAMEAWFAQALGVPYRDILDEIGLPAAHTEADFQSPCRMGEALAVVVSVERLGSRSLTLAYRVEGADGSLRATGRTVCVVIPAAAGAGFDFQAVALPPDLRARIQAFIDAPDG